MVEALRGLGYSTAEALADIVDNSIAAAAIRVYIDFIRAGTEPSVSVLDNGCGMNRSELVRAMRLGDRIPLDERSRSDLGQFVLVLSTASFSQARRLAMERCL